MIEAPDLIPSRLNIPQDHYDVCKAAGVPSSGNAAANTEDFLDLSGQNKQQSFLPGGFTARGIVALVFSCVSAFLGIAFLVVYGLSDLKFHDKQTMAETSDVPMKDISQTTVTEAYRDEEVK
jgi:iron transport multicopper oxidase